MVSDERLAKYATQKRWIDGRGIFIACAFFLGGLSGGLYLVSAYFNNLLGMFISWLLALLMGGCYLMHLTKPLRAWRMPFRPRSSWISRGFIFIGLFIGFVFIQLCLSYWLAGTAWEVTFKVLAGITAFAQAIYTGFVLSYVSAIKFWNSALVPILFVTVGALGGFGIVLAISLVGGHAELVVMENIIRVLLIFYAIILTVYLWNSTYIDSVAKRSVIRLIRGSSAPVFWVGVVLLGIAIPIAISVSSYFASVASAPLLFTAIGCEIVGSFSIRYCILKAGIFSPIIPTSAY